MDAGQPQDLEGLLLRLSGPQAGVGLLVLIALRVLALELKETKDQVAKLNTMPVPNAPDIFPKPECK